MHIVNFIPVISLLTAVCSAVPHSHPQAARRDVSTDVTLYAYGTNISGIPIVYGNSDGLAYISADTSLSTLSSVTWDVTTESTTAWNASLSNSTSAGSFFISPSTYAAAGFTSTNTTVSSNATTTGFSLFGGQVVYVVDDQYESQFWAQTTSDDSVWALYWNADGTAEDNSVPIVVKTLAPSITTSS